MKTHGEEWYKWKCKINSFDYKFEHAERSTSIPQRMSRKDATSFYNKRCRDVFEVLGFKYEEENNFEQILQQAFIKVRANTNKMLKREANKIKRILENAK